MKTVLTISDSVEGTSFDLLRCTATIKDFGLDPIAVVPRLIYQDNTSEENDVSEMLDFAFGECEFSAMSIGYITQPEVLHYVADKLEQEKRAPVICNPSLISEEGEVLVSSEVYSAWCDRVLKFADFLIVNAFEAEAFCGFECPMKNDFLRAAKKIYNVYGCRVLIMGNERTDGQNVLFEGAKPVWIDEVPYEEGYEDKYSILSALTCEYAVENPEHLSAALAIEFVSGKTARRALEAEQKAAAEAAKSERVEAPVEAPVEVPVEKKTETVSASGTQRHFTAVPKLSEDPKPFTSSLVTPGKSIRDLARGITPSVKTEESEHAVTSTIEKTEDPKSEVTPLASSRLLFDSKVSNSITELQMLRDRLNNLNRLADSGK